MAKFYGAVGYGVTEEVSPGVWQPRIVERMLYGDVLANSRRWETNNENQGDNLVISNRISLMADPYALEHFFDMRYITWMGARWKVTSVDASQPPRLICTLGGVYNGPEPTESTSP